MVCLEIEILTAFLRLPYVDSLSLSLSLDTVAESGKNPMGKHQIQPE